MREKTEDNLVWCEEREVLKYEWKKKDKRKHVFSMAVSRSTLLFKTYTYYKIKNLILLLALYLFRCRNLEVIVRYSKFRYLQLYLFIYFI